MHTLRSYDGPQAGVIEQHGVRYLFQALFDLPSGLGVWICTWISEDEAKALAAAADPDDADNLANAIADERTGQLAVVIGGRVAQVTETAGTGREALTTAMRALTELMAEQTRGFDEIAHLVPA